MALHRLADFCVVSSLHDGMNLVAKEFVASRHDEDGVLVLSRFTGSARELADALLVNPFAVDEIAEALHRRMTMPEGERAARMERMREQVRRVTSTDGQGVSCRTCSASSCPSPAETRGTE